MRTYLSIDIDYWICCEAAGWMEDNSLYDPDPDLASMTAFLSSIPKAPTLIVDEHHHILDHINESAPDRIVHVDYHMDVAYPYSHQKRHQLQLNCGTFFYFVDGRERMSYEWRYPAKECREYSGLCVDPDTKPMSKKMWIFAEQRGRIGLPPIASLGDVVGIGVALSRDFCDDRMDKAEAIVRKAFPGARWDQRAKLEAA